VTRAPSPNPVFSAAGEAGVDLSQVQGNIVPGLGKAHQAFVLVTFPTRAAGRLWLRAIQPEVASSADVYAFKAGERAPAEPGVEPPGVQRAGVERRAGELNVAERTGVERTGVRWVNVALSWRGLQVLLGSAAVAGMPRVFIDNVVPFCERQPRDANVHALLQVGADTAEELDSELRRGRQTMERCGVAEVHVFRGRVLEDHIEHFGFKDGVSSVAVEGFPAPGSRNTAVGGSSATGSRNGTAGSGALLPQGEFFFGELDGLHRRALPGPEWTRGGTFVAFMQLEQDVEAFRAAVQRSADRLRLTYDQMGARLVGRDAKGIAAADPALRLSHVGRAHPHWIAGVARHRIIRRGIPYGDPLPAAGGGGERGLLFVSYQADLVRQFEQVWRVWLNAPDFPGPGAQRDGLVGQPGQLTTAAGASSADTRPVAVSRGAPTAGVDQLSMPRFVKPHYGGYFMAPSMRALSRLSVD
jgi:Dyp-type peroxidase family